MSDPDFNDPFFQQPEKHPPTPYVISGPAARQTQRTSGLAIASLVLGILAPCTCITSIPAIICGAAGLWEINRSRGFLKGTASAITGIVFSTLAILMYLAVIVAPSLDAPSTQVASSIDIHINMQRQILAVHNYQSNHRTLPRYANFDAEGKPLLSWRVHLLPYLDEQNLYEQFHLDEPWDSPHNRQLLNQMPQVYEVSGDFQTPANHTRYLAVTGPGTVFGSTEEIELVDVLDGMSNTIVMIEAPPERAVPWTKPADWDYSAPGAIRGFAYSYQVGLLDGTVQQVNGVPPNELRPAFTFQGREPITMDQLLGL